MVSPYLSDCKTKEEQEEWISNCIKDAEKGYKGEQLLDVIEDMIIGSSIRGVRGDDVTDIIGLSFVMGYVIGRNKSNA